MTLTTGQGSVWSPLEESSTSAERGDYTPALQGDVAESGTVGVDRLLLITNGATRTWYGGSWHHGSKLDGRPLLGASAPSEAVSLSVLVLC